MPFPIYKENTGVSHDSNVTEVSLNLNNVTGQNTELLITLVATNSTNDLVYTTSGWTELVDGNNTSGGWHHVGYRIRDGSEGSTVIIDLVDTPNDAVGVCVRIAGLLDHANPNIEKATYTGASATTHSAPSLTHTSGVGNYLSLVVMFYRNTTGNTQWPVYDYPSGYTQITDRIADTTPTNEPVIWAGYKNITDTDTEDPGDFTLADPSDVSIYTFLIPGQSQTKMILPNGQILMAGDATYTAQLGLYSIWFYGQREIAMLRDRKNPSLKR